VSCWFGAQEPDAVYENELLTLDALRMELLNQYVELDGESVALALLREGPRARRAHGRVTNEEIQGEGELRSGLVWLGC
jgi:hypothetical protein